MIFLKKILSALVFFSFFLINVGFLNAESADMKIAKAYFEKASICYEEVDFPCALKFYREALKFSESEELKIKIYEQIIVIYHALDQSESALEIIRRIYDLDYAYKPDPLFYPPKILALFREIRPSKEAQKKLEQAKDLENTKKINAPLAEEPKKLLVFDSDIQHYFGENRQVFHNALQLSSSFFWQISGTSYYLGPRLKYYRQKKVSSSQVLENIGLGMASLMDFYEKDDWLLRLKFKGSIDFWSLNQKLTKVGVSFGWSFLPGFRYENITSSMVFGVTHYVIPSNKDDDRYVNFNSILAGLLFTFEL